MTQGIITGYSHINLPVNDLAKSIAFYTETLGFSLLRKWSVNGREAAYVCFQDILLELTTPSRPTPADEDRTETRMGFTVNDRTQPLTPSARQGLPSPVNPGTPRPFGVGRRTSLTHPVIYWPFVSGGRCGTETS